MLILRSIAFNLFFYLATALQLVFWTPVYFFLKPEDGWKVVKCWGWLNLWAQTKIVGATFEFRGQENIPQNEPYIVASKHQSTWETFVAVIFLQNPSYILKKELLKVPFFGWFARKMKVVAVDRGKRTVALQSMTAGVREQYNANRQIVIYPEGTRTLSYAPPKYRYGITHLYREIGVTVLPVALNSGLFWGRHSFLRPPGHFVMEFLPVIRAGLSGDEFSEKLVDDIEGAVARLNAETDPNPPASK